MLCLQACLLGQSASFTSQWLSFSAAQLALLPQAHADHAAQALNASSIIWNAHLLNGTEPALDLNDANIVAGIMEDAAGHVYATKDYLLPTQLNQLSSMQYTAAATAAANLNQLTENFNDATTLAKTSYYTQDQVSTMSSCFELQAELQAEHARASVQRSFCGAKYANACRHHDSSELDHLPCTLACSLNIWRHWSLTWLGMHADCAHGHGPGRGHNHPPGVHGLHQH